MECKASHTEINFYQNNKEALKQQGSTKTQNKEAKPHFTVPFRNIFDQHKPKSKQN